MSWLDEPLEPDPVIEHYKKDVDRSLLRANLRLTPEQRLLRLQDALRLLDEMRDAMKRARGAGTRT